jgi:hypothetical protein
LGQPKAKRPGYRGHHAIAMISDDSNYPVNQETSWVFRTKEYRGCGIRAASYKVGLSGWIPNACFWLHTDGGLRRLWVASFAHCLATHDLTFPNKIEADACAFNLARTLIDKTLPEFDLSTSYSRPTKTKYLAKMLAIVRRPFSAYHLLKDHRLRN